MNRRRVLIVDDEQELRAMLSAYLTADGFEVLEASDGEQALELAQSGDPNVVILDVGLPGIDGFEVLRRIRSFSDVPVIMLTARSEEVDRVVGLTVGADDYVTKPFSPRELSARIGAVLRRASPAPASSGGEVLQFEGLSVDLASREVTCDGRAVELTALEFDLLVVFAQAPRRVYTREQLMEMVWGWDYVGVDRVVDVHISNLRKALDDSSAEQRFIGTVRGVGYKFIGEAT
ncbi:MAG: response regulator transcription factor [Acidimicrobiia bacterium]|nr:response regulator transcription factor [Acidimicrobiia bacterium]